MWDLDFRNFSSVVKAEKVIDSCKTIEHIEVAENFLQNLYKYIDNKMEEETNVIRFFELSNLRNEITSRLEFKLNMKYKEIMKGVC